MMAHLESYAAAKPVDQMTGRDTLNDPNWFLHRFLTQSETFIFVRSDRSELVGATFLDDRHNFRTSDDARRVSFDEALAWSEEGALERAARIIAHKSFCGSTLLARLVDRDPSAVSYKEPQVILDVADLKAARRGLAKDPVRWPVLLRFVLSQLSKTWSADERVVIKPSNWANNILPDIARHVPDAYWAFVGIDLHDYIVANLRGGKERLAYSLKLFDHLAQTSGPHRRLAKRLDGDEPSTVRRVLKLLALSHRLQGRLFDDAESAISEDRRIGLTKAELQGAPQMNARRVRRRFSLPEAHAPSAPAESIEAVLSRHAKAPGQNFDLAREQAMDRRIIEQFGADIDAALVWAGATLAGPSDQLSA